MRQSIIDLNPADQNTLASNSESQSNIRIQLEDVYANYKAFHRKLVSFRQHIYDQSFFELNQFLHNYCTSAEYIISKLEQRLRAMSLTIYQRTSCNIVPYNLYSISSDKLSSNEMLHLIIQSQRSLHDEIKNIQMNADMINDRDTVKLTSSIIGNIGHKAWGF